jgi:hypothetical protein
MRGMTSTPGMISTVSMIGTPVMTNMPGIAWPCSGTASGCLSP